MLSHKFRVNAWAKRKQTPKDHFHFLMNSTNAQRSFIHEVTSQMLGHKPSNLWGVPVPHEFRVHADKDTLHFIRHASKQAPHEFGRLISSHKKASGWTSAFGDAITSGAKAAAKYGKTAALWAIKNSDNIKTGVGIVKGLVQTGTSIAQIAGVMGQDRKDQLDAIADAVNKHIQENLGTKKEKPKKGGSFGKVLI